jgi:hypothetical protein
MNTRAGDNLQHRLLREPARFVEDVRVAADGQVQARIWSLAERVNGFASSPRECWRGVEHA